MSSLASCWCPGEVSLQVTFEELQGWLMSEDQMYDGGKGGVGDRVDWMSREFDMS